jgi:hypothetical protein
MRPLFILHQELTLSYTNLQSIAGTLSEWRRTARGLSQVGMARLSHDARDAD